MESLHTHTHTTHPGGRSEGVERRVLDIYWTPRLFVVANKWWRTPGALSPFGSHDFLLLLQSLTLPQWIRYVCNITLRWVSRLGLNESGGGVGGIIHGTICGVMEAYYCATLGCTKRHIQHSNHAPRHMSDIFKIQFRGWFKIVGDVFTYPSNGIILSRKLIGILSFKVNLQQWLIEIKTNSEWVIYYQCQKKPRKSPSGGEKEAIRCAKDMAPPFSRCPFFSSPQCSLKGGPSSHLVLQTQPSSWDRLCKHHVDSMKSSPQCPFAGDIFFVFILSSLLVLLKSVVSSVASHWQVIYFMCTVYGCSLGKHHLFGSHFVQISSNDPL